MFNLLALLVLLWAAPASAQNVTCATRPTGDDSNACASTAFVVNNTGLGSNIVNLDSYVQTGDTSDCEAFPRAITAAAGGIVRLPARVINLGTVGVACNITITSRVTIEGAGWQETTQSGTILNIVNTSGSPFTLSGTDVRGASIKNLAVKQTHPTAGVGWAPTVYPVVFNVSSTLGEVRFENLFAYGIYSLISASNSGRLFVDGVRGQVFSNLITVDTAYDVVRLNDIQLQAYWSSDTNVLSYQQANLTALTFKRVDTPYIDNFFMIHGLRGILLSSSADGVTTKLETGKFSCDFTKYCVDVTGDAVVAHFSILMAQSEDSANAGVPLAGGRAIRMASNAAYIDVGLMEVERYALEAAELTSAAIGSQLTIGSLRCNLVNVNNVAGTGCAKDAGTSDTLKFLTDPYIVNSNSAAPVSTGTVGVGNVQKNMVASRASWPYVTEVATGGTVTFQTTGTDSNRAVSLASSGTSRVYLTANSKNVFSVDDFNGNGDTGMLCRSAVGALDCQLESSSSNAGLTFASKGTSPITMTKPMVPATSTIAALPTCAAGILGAIAVVSNGTDYATGTYGAAVGGTGIVTRKVLCTNTAGATTYAWAYN